MDPNSPVVFSLDQPAATTVASRRVVFSGWCHRRDGEPIDRVRAVVRWRRIEGVCGQPRPDVARHFDGAPGTALSGFQVTVILSEGSHDVRVEAHSPRAGWVPLAARTIVCHPPPRRFAPAVWGRFAWRFRRSFRAAWDGLDADERAALRAFCERRDLLRLGILEQHAPAAAQIERLPRNRLPAARLPKISIVTPSYNQAAFLAQTMRSVLDQNYPHLDYLVLDGGSTDGSADLIHEFSPRLKYSVSEPDRGQSDAVCKGLARIECGPDDVVAYLNSDDTLLPGALGLVGGYFASHPEVDVLYGDRILVDDVGREIGRWISPRPDADDLKLVDYVPQETLFWRKRAQDRAGGIDPSLHFALDWDLLLRFAATGAILRRVPYYLGCFRVHPAQKTSSRIHDVGRSEMELLRRRSLGREATPDEIAQAVERDRLESALLLYLRRWGIRL